MLATTLCKFYTYLFTNYFAIEWVGVRKNEHNGDQTRIFMLTHLIGVSVLPILESSI